MGSNDEGRRQAPHPYTEHPESSGQSLPQPLFITREPKHQNKKPEHCNKGPKAAKNIF